MVRKKAVQKKKLDVSTSSGTRSTPGTSKPSTSLSPVRHTPRSKQLDTSKTKSIKKKKRKQSSQMRVGSKLFLISAKILNEVKYYQTSADLLIPKLSFFRLVQEILCEYSPEGRRIQRAAVEALQEACEYYLVQYLEDSYICSLHARRCTLQPRDMQLVQRLRNGY